MRDICAIEQASLIRAENMKGAFVEGIFQVNANIIIDKLGIPISTHATRHTDVAISGAFIAH